jgi:hypothetical protein
VTVNTLVDVMGAVGLVALVMMLTRPKGKGPELVRSIAGAWQRAVTVTVWQLDPTTRRS